MIIIITGASHTGKTFLAQRMLEQYKYPYLSIDHLKMGLIRSGNTDLTPEDDDELTEYLWPIVREMIKTAIENHQNLIVEGCYVPFNWRLDFEDPYLHNIRFICLAMSRQYIEKHFDEVAGHESEIESRAVDTGISAESLKKDNEYYINGFKQAGEQVAVIDSDFEQTLTGIMITMNTVFESENIKYVEVTEFLIEDYIGMVNDMENVGRLIGIPGPVSREDELKWVRGKIDEKAPIFSMIEKKSGEYIGNIELMDVHNSEAELGIAIIKDKQEQGYGTEAISAMIDHGRNVLGLKRIFLKAYPFNTRAIHVYEKCGFTEYERDDKDVFMEITCND